MEEKPKSVIFDFDGTIADTMLLSRAIADEILPTLNLEPLTDKDILKLRGMTIPQALRYMKIPVYKLPQLVILARQKLSLRLDELKPCIGMQSAITEMHKQGLQLGIITSNSLENVDKFLNRHQLRDKFDFVDGGVGLFTKARKLKQTMKRHDIDASNSVYVGDEIRDIEAAKVVGMDSIAVGWGLNTAERLADANPTHVADNADELVTLLTMGSKLG